MSRGSLAIAVAVGLVGCDSCPPMRPAAFPSCGGPDCGSSLLVRTSDDPDTEPFMHCDGFPRSDEAQPDACTFASPFVLGSSWAGGSDADLVATTAPTIVGYFYRLEVEARDGGRARLCRLFVTDVDDGTCSPGAECAVAGEVVLTAGGGGTVIATFDGGETIDGAF